MTTTRSDRGAAARARIAARLRELTRGPLASRRRRTGLAIAYLAAVGVAAAGPLVGGRPGIVVTGLGVVLAMAGLRALRRATRWLADVPSDALDDVFARLQGECFRFAYQVLGAGVVLVSALLLITGGSPGSTGVPSALAESAGWLLLGLAIGLPVAVFAITVPDVDPEPESRRPPGASAPARP